MVVRLGGSLCLLSILENLDDRSGLSGDEKPSTGLAPEQMSADDAQVVAVALGALRFGGEEFALETGGKITTGFLIAGLGKVFS